MENTDYKLLLFEIISALKDKALYLKNINANNYDSSYYEGMKFAYHITLDTIKEYLNNYSVDEEIFGLKDFDPKEILDYKPISK